MSPFSITRLSDKDRTALTEGIRSRWGSERMVAHQEEFYPAQFDGFLAVADHQLLGWITYRSQMDGCEILILDSLRPGEGIGGALIEAVRREAEKQGCRRLWLITTNDNLNALRFYQKQGFELVCVYRHAVDEARKIKPEIPQFGENGIPLHDEIELEMILSPDEKLP